jgi:glycosyltransferase involved in cell wall biosynthesis
MKILNFSTLFPNAQQPTHGIFVENRLRHLVANGDVTAHVVAPVPYFPATSKVFGKYANFAKVPKVEFRHGLTIHHPRYFLFPKVGMNSAPTLMFKSIRTIMEHVIREHGPFDLIDAHYFYPDGVAAAHLADAFDLPFTVTARGTDINLIPQYEIPKKQILWAASKASGIITVCQALKDEIENLATPRTKLPPIKVLRNGVDLRTFRPADRSPARKRYGAKGTTLLSVGHLIERKGHNLVIDALRDLPDMNLLIAGDGPEGRALKSQVAQMNLEDRVTFLGTLPHETLFEVYSAADILVLASSREGWPNVLLEAMACGTPVVATDVWGSSEVVGAPEAGRVVKERSAESLAKGIKDLLTALPNRTATRTYAEGFSWDATTRGQIELFTDILSKRAS